MTQEDKQLLLKDLCARFPYGLVVNTGDKDLKLDRQHQNIGILYPEDCSDEFNERNNASFYIIISGCYYGEEIKPYLRPISSMTGEEVVEIDSMGFAYWTTMINNDLRSRGPMSLLDAIITHHKMVKLIDWFNTHHFDYRGLIEKGLALEAPEGMYK